MKNLEDFMKDLIWIMVKYNISSEYTAQASIFQPNRMVKLAIGSLYHDKGCKVVSKHSKVADQGCGKLRHLGILTGFFQRIYLVDQHSQLARKQTLFGNSNTNIVDYVKKKFGNGHISTMPSTKFSKTKLNLDLVNKLKKLFQVLCLQVKLKLQILLEK